MYLRRINYLRGLLALSVATSHIGHFIPGTDQALIRMGTTAVMVFTVIAGYFGWKTVIKTRREPASLFLYMKAKVLRIYPVYWATLALIFMFVAIGMPYVTPLSGSLSSKDWLESIFLIYFHGSPSFPLYPAWWLPYLIIFQLFLLPIIWRYWTWPVMLALGVSGMIIFGRLWPAVPLYGLMPISFLFVIGAGIAVHDRLFSRLIRLDLFFIILGFALLSIYVVFMPSYGKIIQWSGAILLFLGSLLRDMEMPLSSNRFVWKMFEFLGDISYSLYISHALAFSVIFYYLRGFNPLPLYYVNIVMAILFAALLYNGVERRFIVKKS